MPLIVTLASTPVGRTTLQALGAGPCSQWVTPADLRLEHPAFTQNGTTDAQLNRACDLATLVVWGLSGRQWSGPCPQVVRPIPDQGGWTFGTYRSIGDLADALADDTVGPLLAQPYTGLDFDNRVDLGEDVVTAVTQVLVDGQVVDPASYQLQDYRYLVRLADSAGARRSWPLTQRLDLPSSAVGTFEVTMSYGAPPPSQGQDAALILASYWAFARYPKPTGTTRGDRVTQINRQGVSMTLADPVVMLSSGRTGISEVDAFIATVNPHGVSRPARVYSPDMPRRTHRVNT